MKRFDKPFIPATFLVTLLIATAPAASPAPRPVTLGEAIGLEVQ